jgi:hypothetical protein
MTAMNLKMTHHKSSWTRCVALTQFLSLLGIGLLLVSGQARADQVIADDLIVQGSLCVGLDCVNGESFGFDTIRLKENNLRIKFDDTSVSAGFPNHDWQLTANDSANGGLNKFSIEDITAATIPFTVEGSSPTNSIYVDSTGRVGFRTASPVLDLHVSTSNTPGLRLDQNASGGFTSQVWDIAGNEANFFVRDVTGGSKLPFRIRPGAATSSIDISSAGNVGIGFASPTVQLHVREAAVASTAETIAQFDVSDDGIGKLVIGNNSAGDNILHPKIQGTTISQAVPIAFEGLITDDLGLNPAFSFNAAKIAGGALAARPLMQFRNYNVTKVTISANGDVTATSFSPPSSRALKENIVDLETSRAADALRQLTPVEYAYKDNPGRKHVGFIAEDVPDLVANPDRKSVPIMDVVALVTKVVKDQQQTIDEQKKTIDELTKRLNALESRMQDKP